MKIVDDVENGIFSCYLKCSCDENNVFVHDGAEGDGVEPEHVDVAVGRQLGQQIDHVLQPGVALPDKEWDRLLILRDAFHIKFVQTSLSKLAELSPSIVPILNPYPRRCHSFPVKRLFSQ